MSTIVSATAPIKLNLDPHREKKRSKRKASSTIITARYVPSSPVDPIYYVGRSLDNPKTSEELCPPEPIEEVPEEDDDEDERENWTGRLDFLLSCIGYAVGLGNIWRFPYLCYSSGGGAFLVPYAVFLVLCALPLFFMETSYGQFSSLSPITVWRICPLFKGIGYGMVIITGIVCVYYNIIITWTFFFVFSSMHSTLPWGRCDNSWNTDTCVGDGSTWNKSAFENKTLTDSKGTPSSVEFWERNVLKISKGIEDFGGLRLELFGCLALAWTTVFLCIFKGVKSSGKVVYVTATFPYLVLSILLGTCITLPGAPSGVKWYLVPQWEKLASFKVWGDAATQIFFSVGMAWGSLITLSSYNKFSNNVFRDAMIVPIINCLTSVFAGLVIFSVLGFMSHALDKPIEKVVTQGPGLIFIVYPEAVTRMPMSHLWAILFFLMIFSIGLDSQFGMFETMTSAFVDEYPRFLRKNKVLFTAFMCLLEFLLGTPMVFEGGFYLLTLSDWYSSSFSLMLLSLIECLVISWIYGVDRFRKDIELMTGNRPCIVWKIMWKYVTPCIVLFTWMFSLNQLERIKVGDYDYPDWAIVMGWSFALCSIIPVPIYAFYAVYTNKTGTVKQRILKLSQPSANFGPTQPDDKMRYFRSFDDFDWLRFNAVRKDMDWRTYQRQVTEGNRSESNMAAALDSEAVEAEQVQIILDRLSRYEKELLKSAFFQKEGGDVQQEDKKAEERKDWYKHALKSADSSCQGDIERERRDMSMWRVEDETTLNKGKHVRCYSI